jgi:uncharacterized membrane protein
MHLVIAYVTALIVFVLVDAIWLSVMGNLIYRPILGDILLPSLRVAPAVVFYAMFPVGIVLGVTLAAVVRRRQASGHRF